mmetsp:Transcript_155022/g.496922  ORF Transcript_155022/g.496922 Transcript_155022/m.496922 type:complete len:261 (+) Transcript_155022:619-1401(+)
MTSSPDIENIEQYSNAPFKANWWKGTNSSRNSCSSFCVASDRFAASSAALAVVLRVLNKLLFSWPWSRSELSSHSPIKRNICSLSSLISAASAPMRSMSSENLASCPATAGNKCSVSASKVIVKSTTTKSEKIRGPKAGFGRHVVRYSAKLSLTSTSALARRARHLGGPAEISEGTRSASSEGLLRTAGRRSPQPTTSSEPPPSRARSSACCNAAGGEAASTRCGGGGGRLGLLLGLLAALLVPERDGWECCRSQRPAWP